MLSLVNSKTLVTPVGEPALQGGATLTMLVAKPFIGVTTMPTGFKRVGSPAGYSAGLLLYSFSTRMGTENAADFPSPVAVQQRISSSSSIAETRSYWTPQRPSFHAGISFLTMFWMVSRPIWACHRALRAMELFESGGRASSAS
jgi:hypothetical protein